MFFMKITELALYLCTLTCFPVNFLATHFITLLIYINLLYFGRTHHAFFLSWALYHICLLLQMFHTAEKTFKIVFGEWPNVLCRGCVDVFFCQKLFWGPNSCRNYRNAKYMFNYCCTGNKVQRVRPMLYILKLKKFRSIFGNDLQVISKLPEQGDYTAVLRGVQSQIEMHSKKGT